MSYCPSETYLIWNRIEQNYSLLALCATNIDPLEMKIEPTSTFLNWKLTTNHLMANLFYQEKITLHKNSEKLKSHAYCELICKENAPIYALWASTNLIQMDYSATVTNINQLQLAYFTTIHNRITSIHNN